VNSVLNLRVPYNAGKLSSVQTTRDLSSSAQLHGVIAILDIIRRTVFYIKHDVSDTGFCLQLQESGTDNNSSVVVRERTIPTEQPPIVGKVSTNFCGYRGVA
jgi:hypothetical protein